MATINPGSPEAAGLATSVSTTDLVAQSTNGAPVGDATLDPQGTPEPRGSQPLAERTTEQGENADPTSGTGVEGEVVVWEASYSKRNFIGRALVRLVLTFGWIALAAYTWGMGHEGMARFTWLVGAVVGVLWIALVLRMLQAHHSHHYKLTNRRLFVSTGIVHRRRDMMELLGIKDVFTRQQSLLDRWLGLGTVVIVPNEKDIPTFYLAGVDDPKELMDLIWHHARSERDHRSVKVDQV